MREGSLEAPTRHAVDWQNPDFWDEAKLDKYLEDPRAFMPGNKMAFVGVKDEQDRKDLIAYLKQFSKK